MDYSSQWHSYEKYCVSMIEEYELNISINSGREFAKITRLWKLEAEILGPKPTWKLVRRNIYYV